MNRENFEHMSKTSARGFGTFIGTKVQGNSLQFKINNIMNIKEIKKLIKVWLLVTSRVAQSQMLTSWGSLAFLVGKIVRFLLFFVFIFSIVNATQGLADFSQEQVIFFFLVFNVIDIMVQFLFRGVYVFRPLVVKGNFDFDLLKPLPSFFRPLFGWTDILDFITLIPLWIYMFYFVIINNLVPSPFAVLFFIMMFLNAIILGFAFHLFISGVALITTEIDHLTMVYRDITSVARFPTDIYQRTIQYILTFTIPVIVLITVPAKALLGILSPGFMLLSFAITIFFLLGSILFWKYALSKYTSASS